MYSYCWRIRELLSEHVNGVLHMEGIPCPDAILLNGCSLSFLPNLSGYASISLYLSAVEFAAQKLPIHFAQIILCLYTIILWPLGILALCGKICIILVLLI